MTDQIGYDTGASGQAQGDFQAVASELTQLINDHNANVNSALQNYSAEQVSETFGLKSNRWVTASNQVTSIINLIQRTMGENDGTAATVSSRRRLPSTASEPQPA